MDQPRGRSPSQGNRQHITPVPSPHLYHHTAQDFGLDPAVSGHTFTTASFNTAQGFTTPFLESTQPQQAQGISTDPSFYPNNHYNHATYQDNQYPAQNLDPSFTQNEYGFQNSGMQQHDYPNNQHYSYDQSFEASQQGAINPADLSKISSPQDHASPNLLSPDHHSSPGQPASPASTNGQYYTPQHSRHQSLDPASAYSLQGEWQGASFQQAQHRRAPSDQSDLSSNAGNSPYLGQQEVFDSVENTHSPYMNPQPDGNTFGMDAFSLGEHASPSHTPYISPRLMPTQAQGLGLSHDVMLGQHQMGVPGPEVYASQAEPYSNTVAMHHRNGSTVSDMGQANQYAPPTIQIDPAPGVSRQNSFEPGNGNFVDQLSPPSSKGGRGRSVSDVTGKRSPLSRSASPAGRSPSVQPSDTLSVHSHSPAPGSQSRDSSPGAGKNRRASTSSINSRDYILDLADPSRPNASPSHSSTRVQKHPANFQCTLCPKKFTRAYNLRSHLRTHTDERPFVCTVCSKAFARQHDRKRHEGLHSGEKKFVCKGELHSTPGTMWGCGRRFARADALGRHFRSEAGRVCIKPLLDEEAIERRNKMMMEQTQYQLNNAGMTGLQPVTQPLMYPDTGNGGFTLPAALLAQYPALQNIDWSQVPSAQDDGLSGNEMYEDEGEDGYLSDMPGQSVQSGMAMGYGEEQEHGQLIYQ